MAKKVFRKLIILAAILMLIYFLKGSITGMTIFEDRKNQEIEKEIKIMNEEIFPPSVYFCPSDNCAKALYDFIDSANASVHCALFDLDIEEIIRILDEKSSNIDVKVVVDNENYGMIKKSYGKKLEFVEQDNQNQLSHNKFCVVDTKKTLTGSFNPTENCAYHNNNNVIIIESKYLAENYEDEFNELWQGYFGRSNKDKQNNVKYPLLNLSNNLYENYFCPDDNCEEHVLDTLKKANASIKFMIFSFTSDKIGDLMVEKANHGIIVEGVVEKTQNTNTYSEYEKLLNAGIDIIYDNNKYNMHHKVFIIDDNIVITGSYNPTSSGNNKNDENILIIHSTDVAKKFLEEFERVYIT